MPQKRGHWRGHYWHFDEEERAHIYDLIARFNWSYAAVGREYGVDGRVISRLFSQLCDQNSPDMVD